MPSPWTKERDAQLLLRAGQGWSAAMIALELNFTRSAVSNRAYRLRVPTEGKRPNPWTDELSSQLRLLVEQGLSASLIGEQLGFTRNAICGRINRLRISLPGKPPKEPRAPRVTKRTSATEAHAINRIVRANNNKAAPILRCVEVIPQHVSVLEVEGCRYPYGGFVGVGIPEQPITFCNHPQIKGSSYCGPHYASISEPSRPLKSQARMYHGTDFARGAA